MKKRYFLKMAILVLAIIFISFSAQAYTNTANDSIALNSDSTFLLNEESQNFTMIITGVEGRVTDPEGYPVEGVRVTVYFLGEIYWDDTNGNGEYDILLPNESGFAYVTFEKECWQTYEEDVIINRGQVTQLDVTLYPLLTGIEGIVKDAFSGKNIPGVKVTVWFNGKMYTTHTNWAGYFSIVLPTLDDIDYAFMEFEKVGYWTGYRIVEVIPCEWVYIEMTLTPYPRPYLPNMK